MLAYGDPPLILRVNLTLCYYNMCFYNGILPDRFLISWNFFLRVFVKEFEELQRRIEKFGA